MLTGLQNEREWLKGETKLKCAIQTFEIFCGQYQLYIQFSNIWKYSNLHLDCHNTPETRAKQCEEYIANLAMMHCR